MVVSPSHLAGGWRNISCLCLFGHFVSNIAL
jgi:hypothetical protein